mgnify:FL=1
MCVTAPNRPLMQSFYEFPFAPNEAVNLTRSRWLFKVLACLLEARPLSRASYLGR